MQILPDGQLYAPCTKCGERILIPRDMFIDVRSYGEKDYTQMTALDAVDKINLSHSTAWTVWKLVCVRCSPGQAKQP